MAPVLQKLRQHHQNATPLAQLPAAEQSILNLFRVVYGSGPAVQELDRIESTLLSTPNVSNKELTRYF